MKVPQFSPWIGQEEYDAIKKCFDQNWITEGPISKEFSQKLLQLIGSKYGVFAPNGTLALYLGLKACGIKPGDEVIVPDFTFIASANSVEMLGARPVFIDVNRKNFQIDISKAELLITKKTKAIMPVHIYGTICDMDPIIKFANKHNLYVIEDAAEAIGVKKGGKHAGTFGQVGCFSFFADKTITTAEGGFIVTDDEKIYENLLYLRNQGRIDRGSFIHPRIGYNFRMTDIQNAIGLVQLQKLEKIKDRKSFIKKKYLDRLSKIKGIDVFEPDKGADWIPFRIGILTEKAHALMAFMKTKDIEARTFFYPLHRQPCFEYLRDKNHKNTDQEFPNSTYGYEHGLCLPTFPELRDEQIDYVVDSIEEFMNRDIFYKYYDVIFNDKDYKAESDLLIQLADKYMSTKPNSVLEIGCGTGNHTLELTKKGFKEILAIDIDPEMIDKAKEKINGVKNVRILYKNILDIDEKFDLVAALFNVVTYIDTPEKLESFMAGVSKVLNPGGIFVFDCWNGIAAIIDPPTSKNIIKQVNGLKIESKLSSETDIYNQMATLKYNISAKNKNDRIIEKGEYIFTQTLWSPREINASLTKAGLEVLSVSPLYDTSKKATEKDWKILYCVKKK